MDTQRHWLPFRDHMNQLVSCMRDGDFKASDNLVQAHWDAAKDMDFADWSANMKRFIASATDKTPMPRPSMLRNKPASVAPTAADFAHERAARESARAWESLRNRDPVEYAILVRIARLARELIDVAPEDPDFADLERAQARWCGLRYAARAEQEAAVKAYCGV